MTTSVPEIKLLAIDIDGTLLTPEKSISEKTRTAIHRAQAEGIIVTLATARRYGNSKQYADELGISIPLIICDGALVINHLDGTVLDMNPLPAEIAQHAAEIMVSKRVQPVVQHINRGMEETWAGPSKFDNPELEGYSRFIPHLRRMSYDILCQGQPDPLRVVAFASKEAIESIIAEIPRLPCSWNSIKEGNYGSAEISIMNQSCSKASGVARLAKRLGIELSQVMAIGDNNNDIEMLRAVGWGVAMGQATDYVKACAQAVTTSNAEDGVAVAIERYALRSASKAASNSLNR
jgi:Cof subfamily protein (haloacid dehalogenase superfamily)